MSEETLKLAREFRDRHIGRGSGLTITTQIAELLAEVAEQVASDCADIELPESSLQSNIGRSSDDARDVWDAAIIVYQRAIRAKYGITA